MGNYTELKFKAVLKEYTPTEVIKLLNRVINEKDLGIDLHMEFKNYDGEISEFIDWITLYIIGENGKCLGYYQTEVADEPINIYIERGY